TAHDDYTDPLAIMAIKMVFDHLQASYEGNMDSRASMHDAQCLAGMAFSNALLGITHSMAHKTGAAFSTGHITHGLANAIYLPYVIRYNARDPLAAARYADISRKAGLEGASKYSRVNSLCEKIQKLNSSFGIPSTLQELGIPEAEFNEKLSEISENAVADACTGSNPRPIDPENMAKLFTAIYYGKQVDF
ncbi:MAG: iron-containing alcohol dehydrogenase, partial [Oscillospiraceae bacterium]|nr:iron-containing alcohol dehydrogenase [Oscillospiraceae bacterium]